MGQRRRVRLRIENLKSGSCGIEALFAGVLGTGKTMAAEVLAAEFGLVVCKVDLGSVVSKCMGRLFVSD
jgi:SpoVK/Ycf46/Vps4 family AAA+-type ATPase